MNYLDLLPPDSRRKTRFTALVSSVLSQVEDLFALCTDLLPAALSLGTATGAQLDALGVLAGCPRPANLSSDETFRNLIRARIALHRWAGTNESLTDALAAAFPGQDVRVIDGMDGSVQIDSDVSLPLDPKELYPVPVGIRVSE